MKTKNYLKGLRALRTAAGLTQWELSKKLDVSQAAVTAWENGLKCPAAEKLPDLAAALGCSIDALYQEPAEVSA